MYVTAGYYTTYKYVNLTHPQASRSVCLPSYVLTSCYGIDHFALSSWSVYCVKSKQLKNSLFVIFSYICAYLQLFH